MKVLLVTSSSYWMMTTFASMWMVTLDELGPLVLVWISEWVITTSE